MKKNIWILLLIGLSVTGCKKKKQAEKERMCSRVDIEKVLSFLPESIDEINLLGSSCKQGMNDVILGFDLVQAKNRVFANTIRPYEVAKLEYLINKNVLSIFAALSSNYAMQVAANSQLIDLGSYESDILDRNVSIYKAFKEYIENGLDVYVKRGANQQFLHKKIQEFERKGMLLPVDQRTDLIALDKEVQSLAGRFNGNIVYDHPSMVVCSKDLLGIPESFVQQFKKNEAGDYIIPIDFNTFFMIMENCESEKVRKEFFLAFGQRAYPQNKELLKQLLQKRYEFAQTLGYSDFATYELSDQMIQSPKKAEKFLWHMVHELQKYDQKDFEILTKQLPSSVSLTQDKKMKPWDEAFIKSSYRKKHFLINDYTLSQYFPLDHTLEKMLRIFSTFFSIEFKKEDVAPHRLWAPDVVCYQVYSLKNQQVLGYLFLDLYKHDYKKVQEPCHFMMIPTIKDDCSIACAGSSVMVAQFTQPTVDKPTLLEFSDVISLFHELGHALHALFGSACFVDYSGTQVVQDFVEVPSEMLEYWLQEESVLSSISCHYKTGQLLPKDVIEQILAAEQFGKAGRMLKQAFLGLVSLYAYKDGHKHDFHKMVEKLYKKVFQHMDYELEYYFEYSFAHLINYGASYYTYLWSRVIAADLFRHIKLRGGIDNSDIGREYVKDILSHGGFISADHMLKKFLKRPFNGKAFLNQFEHGDVL